MASSTQVLEVPINGMDCTECTLHAQHAIAALPGVDKTVGYNAIGLTLAAFGILPPVLAAAAQSLPDISILANSSRLIRQR